jgi:hypothetical protein
VRCALLAPVLRVITAGPTPLLRPISSYVALIPVLLAVLVLLAELRPGYCSCARIARRVCRCCFSIVPLIETTYSEISGCGGVRLPYTPITRLRTQGGTPTQGGTEVAGPDVKLRAGFRPWFFIFLNNDVCCGRTLKPVMSAGNGRESGEVPEYHRCCCIDDFLRRCAELRRDVDRGHDTGTVRAEICITGQTAAILLPRAEEIARSFRLLFSVASDGETGRMAVTVRNSLHSDPRSDHPPAAGAQLSSDAWYAQELARAAVATDRLRDEVKELRDLLTQRETQRVPAVLQKQTAQHNAIVERLKNEFNHALQRTVRERNALRDELKRTQGELARMRHEVPLTSSSAEFSIVSAGAPPTAHGSRSMVPSYAPLAQKACTSGSDAVPAQAVSHAARQTVASATGDKSSAPASTKCATFVPRESPYERDTPLYSAQRPQVSIPAHETATINNGDEFDSCIPQDADREGQTAPSSCSAMIDLTASDSDTEADTGLVHRKSSKGTELPFLVPQPQPQVRVM